MCLAIASILSLGALVMPVGGGLVSGQSVVCAEEVEPNDTLQAVPSATGALCTTGTLPDNDQDSCCGRSVRSTACCRGRSA